MRIGLVMLALGLTACAAVPADESGGSYRGGVEGRAVETVGTGNGTAEGRTPYADLMVYPANWAEISRKRQ